MIRAITDDDDDDAHVGPAGGRRVGDAQCSRSRSAASVTSQPECRYGAASLRASANHGVPVS